MLSLIKDQDLQWLHFEFVMGHDDGDGSEGGAGDDGTGVDSAGDENADDTDDEGSLEGLKKALDKERKLRATAEKKIKILGKNATGAKPPVDDKKTDASDDKKTDSGGADTASQAKLDRLSEAFRMSTLQKLVADNSANFQDPSDVYRFLETDLFEFAQDDDDPSQVVWNESEIKTAVKALAKERPYLLKPSGDGSGGTKKTPTSGPKFAGAGSGKQTGGASRTELARRFPALRTAVRASGTDKKD